MTPEAMKAELERLVQTFTQSRENAGRAEVVAEAHLKAAQANTAFTVGQLATAQLLLSKIVIAPKAKPAPKPKQQPTPSLGTPSATT